MLETDQGSNEGIGGKRELFLKSVDRPYELDGLR